MSHCALHPLMRIRSDVSLRRHLRQPLSVHCCSHLPHPTHEQCMVLRVVTARVLLRHQWFFYVPIGDGTAISTWSSEPREGLTIYRCNSKGSIFALSYFKTLSVGPGKYCSLSYDPYGPASAFFATIDKSPIWGPYAFARAGPEKAVRPYYKSVRPRVLKLQANLSPNWSYDQDKIPID